MELEGRPEIEYPCPWSYKVIGRDEDDVRRAVKVTLEVCLDRGSGDRAWELSRSRTSDKGSYVSLNLSLTVNSEEERDALYAGLKDCPEIVMVI
jgi:putative lipoic acid-binding regulatory protein